MSDSPLKQNKIVSLDSLVPHPRNYRVHPKAQIDKLVLSLQRFGQGRSIVVQDSPDKLVIVAGHGIVEAAQALQWQELRADILPADWSDEQVTGYLIADNLHAQEASDNEELLAMLLQEQQDAGYDLASLGSDDETLRQMLESLGDGYDIDEGEDSRPGPVPLDDITSRAKVGDIWQLGGHRIGCLDSLDPAQVARLLDGHVPSIVWADPPYGINIVADNDRGAFATIGSGKGSPPTFKSEARGTIGAGAIVGVHLYPKVAGDESTETAITCYHLCVELWPKALQFWCGGNYYADHLPSSSCWIVWDKRSTFESEAITSNNFADGELIWTNNPSRVRIYRQLWNGMLRSGTVETRVHPTQKPVDLLQWCFEEYGQADDLIYDPFLGSAPSLIAAERLGDRTVYGCELSPAYIDRILCRWEAETGQTAQLLERLEEPAHV